MQIFISYKREDETFARLLHDDLKSWGYEPWLDVIHILPGQPWDSSIHKGLRDSQVVVAVLTTNALASENVLDEWGYALSTGKRLILLWLSNVIEADIPPRYIRIQRIDFRSKQQEGLSILQKTLASAGILVPESNSAGSVVLLDNPSDWEENQQQDIAVSHDHDVLTSQSRLNRKRMLEKVYSFWIKGLLEESVHKTALIELDIQAKQGVVENPWDTVLQHARYGDYRLPAGTKIADVYHDLNGELLILGDPGSGKTTTLLELARELIVRAQEDDEEPIPVIFNLSSWGDDRQPLAEWLTNELTAKYGASRRIAQEWIESNALILLLDGLDEVNSRYRDECVTQINAYREERGFTRIVVCSRIRDYEALTNQLRLNGAIVLQPLSPEQIDQYLGNLGSEVEAIRQAMINDPTLRELAESPLMLSIMTLAYHGLTSADLPKFETVEAQRSHLFDAYVTRMFERKITDETYTQEQTLYWLSWLARKMVEKTQTVFLIEGLQPDWLNDRIQLRIYSVLLRLPLLIVGVLVLIFVDKVVRGGSLGLIGGVIAGTIIGVSHLDSAKFSINSPFLNRIGHFFARLVDITNEFDLSIRAAILGAILGMAIGGSLSALAGQDAAIFLPGAALVGIIVAAMLAAVIVSITHAEEPIKTVESLKWSLPDALKQIRKTIGLVLFFVVVVILTYSWIGSSRTGFIYAAGASILVLVGMSLASGLQSREIQAKTYSNEGIFQSGRSALIGGLLVGGIGSLLGAGIVLFVNGISAGLYFLVIATPIMVIGASIAYGGGTCLKHFILRSLLYRYGYTPRNYADFLDYAAKRIFLRKVGGGYIFIHRLLLEHFANLKQNDNKSNDLMN